MDSKGSKQKDPSPAVEATQNKQNGNGRPNVPEPTDSNPQTVSPQPAPPETQAGPNAGEETPSNVSRAEELSKKLLYLQAEFENYKKRLAREQEQAIRSANERLIKDLLPVVDLFEHALAASKKLNLTQQNKAPEAKEIIAGIEITHRELVQVLKRFGVELVGVEGEAFNPERHEAISQMDAPPEKANTVLAILHKGCLLYGRLIEPAKVVVGRAGETNQSTEKDS